MNKARLGVQEEYKIDYNNRLRRCLHALQKEFKLTMKDKIEIFERLSPSHLYEHFTEKHMKECLIPHIQRFLWHKKTLFLGGGERCESKTRYYCL